MSELQTTPRLSLFQIVSELHGLIEQRWDAMERMAAMSPDVLTASPEIGEEIAACDMLIKQYLHGHLVNKTDGCSFAIKEYDARADAKAKAAAELKASAERDAETAKRIKAMVLEVMQEFGEKKLPGRLFTITRQGNGGQQALTIAQPDLVPEAFERVTIKCSAVIWRLISGYLLQYWGDHFDMTFEDVRARLQVDREPDPNAIRTALESQQGVPGCRLEERGEHIRIR